MSRRIRGAVVLVLSILLYHAIVCAANNIEFSGSVMTRDGQPIPGVRVSLYRSGTLAGEGSTSRSGIYKLLVPAGNVIDFLVFDHTECLPRVIEGPFSGLMSSSLNVILLDRNTRTASISSTLMQLHSVQFLWMILNERRNLPKTFTIPAKLTLAKMCTTSGEEEIMWPDAPKGDYWSLEDAFFDQSTPRP